MLTVGSGVSPVWSYLLTGIGVVGLALVYARPRSLVGPGIGLAVQLLWVAYAIQTGQWGFLGSAAAYGAANVYGLRSRRRAGVPSPVPDSALDDDERAQYARLWNAAAAALNGYCIRHGYPRPYFSERNLFAATIWRALHPDSQCGRHTLLPNPTNTAPNERPTSND